MRKIYALISSICPIIFILLFGAAPTMVFGQATVTNTVSTATVNYSSTNTTLSGSITVPTGVTVTAQCWGAGGGGGGTASVVLTGADGGGGGGGGYSTGTLTAGTYSYTVGAGGWGGNILSSSAYVGAAGGVTSVGSISANGGGGGGYGSSGNGSAGSAGTGTTKNGGAGAAGGGGSLFSTTGTGGGGGGGAGTTGNGTGGSGRTGGGGGTGGGGAAGGTAPSSDGNGAVGNANGGGGSGSFSKSGSVSLHNGGNGANGQLIITYTMPAPTITTFSPTSYCGTPASTLTITGTGFKDLMGNTLVTALSINGTAISGYTVASSTSITIPAANLSTATTGTISVTTKNASAVTIGTATSGSAIAFNTIPADPGNPTSNAPQCSTIGVTLTKNATAPASGVTWYWQGTSSTGTTTTNSNSTYGPVTSTGIYYIRAQNAAGCWSSGNGSISITSAQLISPPAAGAVSATYGCAGSSLSITTSTGTVNWQGSTDNSTFTDVGATGTTYTIPASSTYTYWRARVSNAPCSDVFSNSVQALPLTISSGNVTITQNMTLGGTITLTNGDFTVNSGVTVTLPQACPLVVNANDITINGTINGDGKGIAGGAGAAAPAGSSSSTSCNNGTANCPGGAGGTSATGSGAGLAGAAGKTGTETCTESYTVIACVQLNNVVGGGGGGAGEGGGNGGRGGTGLTGTQTWSSTSPGAGGGTTTYTGAPGFGTCNAVSSCTGAGATGCPGTLGTAINTITGFSVGGGGSGAGAGGSGGNGAGTAGNNGGNGGGAVQLNFSGDLNVTGAISVNGTDGGTGGNGGIAYDAGSASVNIVVTTYTMQLNKYGAGGGGGGGGGGAGGSVYLNATACGATVNIASTAHINANGGKGGAGGNGGAAAGASSAGVNGLPGGGGGGGQIIISRSACGAYTNNATANISVTSGKRGDNTSGDAVTGINSVTDLFTLVAGTIVTSNQTICYSGTSSTPTDINANPSTGGTCTYAYAWYGAYNASALTTGQTSGSTPASGYSATPAGNSEDLTAAQITAFIAASGHTSGTFSFQRHTGSGSCDAWTTVVTVIVNPVPTVTIGILPEVCFNTGSQTANIPFSSATNSPTQFSIDFTSGISDITNQTFSGTSGNFPVTVPGSLAANIYTGTLTVKNATTGCISNPGTSVSVTVNALPAVTIGTLPSVCYSTSGQTANIPYSGATSSPNKFSIDFSSGIADITDQSFAGTSGNFPVTVTGSLAANTYSGTLTVKNATTGCVSNGAAVSVTVVALPTVTIGTLPSVCYSTSSQTANIPFSSAIGSATKFSINFSSGITDITDQAFSGTSGNFPVTVPGSLAPGVYSGTLTIKNATGCVSNPGASVSVTVNGLPSVTAGNGGPYTTGATINFTSSTSGGATPYGYSWSGPVTPTPSNGANPSISSSTVAMSGNYTVLVTDANGCTATDQTTVVVNPITDYTWTGTSGIDNHWSTATNWSPPGIPAGCTNNVTIPVATVRPTVTSATSIGNVIMQNGSQMSLFADLTVCGTWDGGPSTISTVGGSAVVVFTGGTTHVLTGKNSFNELKLNNTSGGITMSGATVDVYNALDLQHGNFNTTGGTFTLKSVSTTHCAMIDDFSYGSTPGTITGTINAERYYDASSTYVDQHMMGSPVNNPPFSQLGASGTSGFVIPTANCDEQHTGYGSPYSTVFSYHEDNGSTCGTAQWKAEVTGNTQNGVGYSVSRPGAGTLTVSGTPNLNSSYTVSGLANHGWAGSSLQGHAQTAGWQLLSNPYPAPLEITISNSDIEDQVQVWVPNGPGAGTYQPGIVGTSAYIAPFQAFMVHKTSTSGTVGYTIHGTDRVRTLHTFFSQNAEELKITAENTTTNLTDQTIVSFNSNATAHFDPHFDANKFAGQLTRHTLYTVNDNKWMAINTLHSIAETGEVLVGLEPGKTGSYTFNFDGVNSFDPSSYITLEDKALNVMHDVRTGAYNFTADSADNWNRFVLHFTPPVQITAIDAGCNTPGTINVVQPGTAIWAYTITDANNNNVATGNLDQNTPVSLTANAGSYTLTLTDNNGYAVAKSITVNGAQAVAASFNVSATTIPETQNLVVGSTTANATNYQWSFGNGTTAMGQSVTTSYATAGTYNIVLVVTNQYGCTASATQTVTVTHNTATGITNLANDKLEIWSSENNVFVDLTALPKVDATISIFNILGQEISSEKVNTNTLYKKEIDNIEAAYMMVRVKNGDKVITKKVFIANGR